MLTIQALKPRAQGNSTHPPTSPSSSISVESPLLGLVSMVIAEGALDCLGSLSCWPSVSRAWGNQDIMVRFSKHPPNKEEAPAHEFLCPPLQPSPYSCLQKQGVLSPGLSHNLVPLGSGHTHSYFNCLFLNKTETLLCHYISMVAIC